VVAANIIGPSSCREVVRNDRNAGDTVAVWGVVTPVS
jgi:hypothetical protein